MTDTGAVAGPRDAAVMEAILKEMGVEDYDPNVVHQMLEFSYRYITNVLEDARVYSEHAQKKELDVSDVRLAIQNRMDHSFTSPPPRDFLVEIAREKNSTPLPLIPERFGPRLPPERYCLTANNYKVKERPKPASVSKPQVTLAATFKLPLSKQTVAPASTMRQQLSSPLLQSTTAPTPTNMPNLAGLAGVHQNVLNLTQFPSPASLQSPTSQPRQSMPTLTPLSSSSSLFSNTTTNNNSSISPASTNMPVLGRFQ